MTDKLKVTNPLSSQKLFHGKHYTKVHLEAAVGALQRDHLGDAVWSVMAAVATAREANIDIFDPLLYQWALACRDSVFELGGIAPRQDQAEEPCASSSASESHKPSPASTPTPTSEATGQEQAAEGSDTRTS